MVGFRPLHRRKRRERKDGRAEYEQYVLQEYLAYRIYDAEVIARDSTLKIWRRLQELDRPREQFARALRDCVHDGGAERLADLGEALRRTQEQP